MYFFLYSLQKTLLFIVFHPTFIKICNNLILSNAYFSMVWTLLSISPIIPVDYTFIDPIIFILIRHLKSLPFSINFVSFKNLSNSLYANSCTTFKKMLLESFNIYWIFKFFFILSTPFQKIILWWLSIITVRVFF